MHAADALLWRQAPWLRKPPRNANRMAGWPTIWSQKTHAPGLAPVTLSGPLSVWLNAVLVQLISFLLVGAATAWRLDTRSPHPPSYPTSPAGTGPSTAQLLHLTTELLEAGHQLFRVGEGWQVPAVDLVGDDPEALLDHPAQERRLEEAVFPTQQEPRRDLGPGSERPGLFKGSRGLAPKVRRYGCRQLDREVMGEDLGRVEGVWELEAGVSPPLVRRLAGPRHHRCYQHHQGRCELVANQGCGVGTQGVSDHDDATAVAYGIDHGLGVLGQACPVVIAGQTDSHSVMAERLELRHDQVPVPGAVL